MKRALLLTLVAAMACLGMSAKTMVSSLTEFQSLLGTDNEGTEFEFSGQAVVVLDCDGLMVLGQDSEFLGFNLSTSQHPDFARGTVVTGFTGRVNPLMPGMSHALEIDVASLTVKNENITPVAVPLTEIDGTREVYCIISDVTVQNNEAGEFTAVLPNGDMAFIAHHSEAMPTPGSYRSLTGVITLNDALPRPTFYCTEKGNKAVSSLSEMMEVEPGCGFEFNGRAVCVLQTSYSIFLNEGDRNVTMSLDNCTAPTLATGDVVTALSGRKFDLLSVGNSTSGSIDASSIAVNGGKVEVEPAMAGTDYSFSSMMMRYARFTNVTCSESEFHASDMPGFMLTIDVDDPFDACAVVINPEALATPGKYDFIDGIPMYVDWSPYPGFYVMNAGSVVVPGNIVGIEAIDAAAGDTVRYYDLQGRTVGADLKPGLYIAVGADGTTRKVAVK